MQFLRQKQKAKEMLKNNVLLCLFDGFVFPKKKKTVSVGPKRKQWTNL